MTSCGEQQLQSSSRRAGYRRRRRCTGGFKSKNATDSSRLLCYAIAATALFVGLPMTYGFSNPRSLVRNSKEGFDQKNRLTSMEVSFMSDEATSPASIYSPAARLEWPSTASYGVTTHAVPKRGTKKAKMAASKKRSLSGRAKNPTRRVVSKKAGNSSRARNAKVQLDSGFRLHRTYSELLTKEEEILYTNQIRALRRVLRIRDQLTSVGPGAAASVQHQHHRNKVGRGGLKSQVASSIPPSGSEWVTACGLSSISELRQILDDGKRARTKLVDSNVGLVTSIAKRQYYSLKQAMEAGGGVGTILSLSDLVQEGTFGLMEAAERYDAERGVKFGTYATWWIRQRIMKSISDSSRIIRLPQHVHNMLTKINKTRKSMKEKIGREPTTPELALQMDMSEEKIALYTESSRNVVSLELPVNTAKGLGGSFREDRRTLGDSIASDAPTPEEDAQHESLKHDIRLILNNELAERERKVLTARFGLENGKPMTVEETSRALGVSREVVRSAEARALNKLRSPQLNYRLKTYVERSGERSEYPVVTTSHSSSGGLEASSAFHHSSTTRPSKEQLRRTVGLDTVPSDRIWFF